MPTGIRPGEHCVKSTGRKKGLFQFVANSMSENAGLPGKLVRGRRAAGLESSENRIRLYLMRHTPKARLASAFRRFPADSPISACCWFSATHWYRITQKNAPESFIFWATGGSIGTRAWLLRPCKCVHTPGRIHFLTPFNYGGESRCENSLSFCCLSPR